MKVSKLLVIVCLAMLATVLYIATPAVALEHPWEEGESPGVGNGENPGTTSPLPGSDTTGTPFLTASPNGTFFWWLELITGNVLPDAASQNASVVTPADERAASGDHRQQMDRNVK
jgi:hypothetical protein